MQTLHSPINQVKEKNFILCHVRRVMGKKDEDGSEEEDQNVAVPNPSSLQGKSSKNGNYPIDYCRYEHSSDLKHQSGLGDHKEHVCGGIEKG